MNACTVCLYSCMFYVSCTYIRAHAHMHIMSCYCGSGGCQSDELANWQVTGKNMGIHNENVGFMGFNQENEKLDDEHLGIVVI